MSRDSSSDPPASSTSSAGDGLPIGETSPSASEGRLPPHTRWLLGFQTFNALSFAICLGPTMVFTAKYLGASESVVGLLISLTPFLVVLQLTATNVAERWGYRRLMLAGWTARAFALLAIAPLPLLVGRVPGSVLIVAMLVAHLAFNAIRGFTSGTWFPWLTQLIPEGKRGVYLGWDSTFVNLSVLFAFLAGGWFLGDSPEGWRYSVLYGVSFLSAMASVRFLRRVPHRMPPASEERAQRTVRERMEAIRHVWSHKPFRRITRYISLYLFAAMAVPGFLVLYLKQELGWGEGTILVLQGMSTAGVFVSAWVWGWASERAGSRPLMRLMSVGNLVVLAVWTLNAAGTIPMAVVPAGGVILLMSVCNAAHTISANRLILSNCPEDEITTAMPLFQVITSLFHGAAPLVWGVALEVMGGSEWFRAGLLRPFSLFFGVSLGLLFIAQTLLSRVPESGALPTRSVLLQVFWRWPMRVLSGVTTEGRRSSGERR